MFFNLFLEGDICNHNDKNKKDNLEKLKKSDFYKDQITQPTTNRQDTVNSSEQNEQNHEFIKIIDKEIENNENDINIVKKTTTLEPILEEGGQGVLPNNTRISINDSLEQQWLQLSHKKSILSVRKLTEIQPKKFVIKTDENSILRLPKDCKILIIFSFNRR